MDASHGSQTSIHTNITTPPSSSDAGAEYAWLVHSQNTLRDTLPPTVDNKPLARQRRRRTSPEDQAILEAEYSKNSKPDKNARRAIVERVAGMGEKEVQIWFQNRRQNSRRRAQPLPDSQDPPKMVVENSFVSDAEDVSSYPQPSDEPTETAEDASGTPSPRVVIPPPEMNSNGSEPGTEASPSNSQTTTVTVPLKETPSNTTRSLKRSSSGVRISLTSSGGARVLQEHESSPSPPRPERHLTNLMDMSTDDSLLGLSTTTLFPPAHKQRRLTTGRSRDSRSWEFWCDTDASRNELGLKAQQERSGSASDAISLMRSQSSRSALTALDRSTRLRRSDSSRAAKRARPSLARASTTSGALGRGKEGGFELFEDTAAAKPGGRTDSRFVKSPGGDSDKENHDPNALPVPSKRRALGERGAEKASLRKSRTAPSQGNKALRGSGLPRQIASKGHAHETDDELKRFMGRGKSDQEHPAISSEDDLNCVQSLLFLSQGH